MKVAQVREAIRIYTYVEGKRKLDLEQVRCLNCRQVYEKPQSGSTVGRNPGCPGCGYVGWLSVLIPLAEAPRPSASA